MTYSWVWITLDPMVQRTFELDTVRRMTKELESRDGGHKWALVIIVYMLT